MSPDALTVMKMSKPMLAERFGFPMLETDETGHFGFQNGTRFIVTFASVGHMLLIARVGTEYKIVFARIGSPD